MTKTIVGRYESEEEAIRAVEVHALAGHTVDSIVIFTNVEHAKQLEGQTGVTIKTNQPELYEETRTDTMLDKLSNLITSEDDFLLHSEEALQEFGLTADEAKNCMYDVKTGKIIVLADEEMRMGHQIDSDNASFPLV